MTFDISAIARRFLASLLVLSSWGMTAVAADAKRVEPVSFEKDIQPILKQNCTACHNKTKAAGELSLESPESIRKGGSSGPAAVAKKGAESLLVTRSAATDDGQMPPAGNKVGAKRLTSSELGLLKSWIDEGAIGAAPVNEAVAWQPLSASVQPILAIALTADGQYAACSRGNQIFLYHVPTGRLIDRLVDPALAKGQQTNAGAADVDLVRSLAFSPDGKTLASGGFRTIKLWTLAPEPNAPFLEGTTPTTLAIASPDRNRVALVHGNDVHLIDLAGKARHTLSRHTAAVTALAFSPDGTKLLTASADKTACLWNTRDGKPIATLETPASLLSAAITNDGTTGVVGAVDGKCRTFAIPTNTSTGASKLAIAQDWSVASKRIKALASMPNHATQVVFGDDGGNVVVWDAKAPKTPIKTMERTGGELRTLAGSPDGAKIVGLEVGNSLRVWNVADGKQAAVVRGSVHALRQVAQAERAVLVAKSHVAAEKLLLADAEKLAANEADAAKKAQASKLAAIKVQQEKSTVAKKAAEEKAAAEKASAVAEEDAKKTEAAKVVAESAVMAALAAEKGAADPKAALEKTKAARAALLVAAKAATDAGTRARAALAAIVKTVKPLEDATKELNEADSVMNSADRAITSATAAAKRTAEAVPAVKKRLADAEANQKKAEAQFEVVKKKAVEAEKPFWSLAFSPDGKWFAVGGEDALVHTFDVETSAAIDAFAGHGSPIVGVMFTTDHRLASVGANGTALAWAFDPRWRWKQTIGDPASQEIVDRVTALDFSPDGRLLASGGGEASRNGEVKIWNPTTGKLVREIPEAHSDAVAGVRFSPDGATLATVAADKFLKTFDVASGKLLRSFEGHTHHVLGVDWSADGRLLVTAGADNAVKSWDVLTGEQKKSTPGFTKEVTSVAFVGTTTEVIAASGDKTVRLVKADLGQVIKQFAGANDFLYCSAVSADGKQVAAGGKDGILRIWDLATGNEIRSFAPADLTSKTPVKNPSSTK